MNSRLPALPLRLLALAGIMAAVAMTIALGVHHSQPAAANPAYGSIKLNPSSGIIIEGHKVGIPINVTTCSTPPPTYTPTATATNTATATKTSTATPITSTPTSTDTPTSTPSPTPVTFTPTNTPTRTPTETPFPGTALPSPTPKPSSVCRVGSYDVNINYDTSKLGIVTDTGTSTGSNTTTTLVDTTKSWKQNQFASSSVTLVSGGGSDGANGAQIRFVVSNTANTLTVSPAWDGFPVSAPDNTTVYNVGGITDGGWVSSGGRQLQCPIGPTYGASSAELHCITLGSADGVGGSGTLANLSVVANSRGLSFLTFNVAPANPATRVLTIEGSDIPVDVVNGARRVTLCPDASGDGRINSTDLLLIAQSQNARPGNAKYATVKDPDENLVVNSTDLQITASLANKRCIQQ